MGSTIICSSSRASLENFQSNSNQCSSDRQPIKDEISKDPLFLLKIYASFKRHMSKENLLKLKGQIWIKLTPIRISVVFKRNFPEDAPLIKAKPSHKNHNSIQFHHDYDENCCIETLGKKSINLNALLPSLKKWNEHKNIVMVFIEMEETFFHKFPFFQKENYGLKKQIEFIRVQSCLSDFPISILNVMQFPLTNVQGNFYQLKGSITFPYDFPESVPSIILEKENGCIVSSNYESFKCGDGVFIEYNKYSQECKNWKIDKDFGKIKAEMEIKLGNNPPFLFSKKAETNIIKKKQPQVKQTRKRHESVDATILTAFFPKNNEKSLTSSMTMLRSPDFAKKQKKYTEFISKLHKNPKLEIHDSNEVEYKKIVILGVGSFGEVFEMTWNSSKVAVKRYHTVNIYNEKKNDLEEKLLLKELNMITEMNFPINNKFYGVFIQRETGYIHTIHELAKGSLEKKLQEGISDSQKDNYAKGLIEIVIFLVEKGFVHRDFAPKNILVTFNDELKLCDLGSSSKIKQGDLKQSNGPYTPFYAPPEVIKGSVHPNSDIWSMGLIFYLIYYGKNFWDLKNFNEEYVNKVKSGIDFDPEVQWDPRKCPKQIVEIIKGCLHHEASQRKHIKEIDKMLNNYLLSKSI